MKNKIGAICGFVVGLTGFLFLFKIVFLDHIPPEDEVPPGFVVLASILNGAILAFAGYRLQHYFQKKRN